MDLPTVKAAVKSWEKSFRAREGRDPTKEDIKRDPGDIASQYALYRKLTKASSSSSSQSLRPPLSSSTAAPSSSSSSQYRSTPRNIPASEYPTTPTPPSRRVSGSFFSSASARNSQAGPSRSNNTSLGVGLQDDDVGNKSLKRKASKSNISSSPPPTATSTLTSRTLFSTPKKYKAYTGPIHDPNPINPFNTTTTPTKSSPFGPGPGGNVNGLQREKSFSSPFIHASSPKKLKEVLEANSLKKVKERTNTVNEITPRTRARKRLKGEEVEDTPLKQKVPKRKRGQGQARTSEEPLEPLEEEAQQGNFLKPGNRSIFDDDDDEEDELGPSPIKVNDQKKGKGFTSLFGEVEGDSGEDEVEAEEEENSRTINQQISVSARLNGNDASASNKSKAGLDTGKTKNIKKAKGKSNGNSNGNGIMNFFNRISTGKSTLPTTKSQNPEEDESSESTSPIPISEEVPSIQIQSPPLLEPTPSADEIPLIDDISPIMEEAIANDDEPGLASDYTPSASQRRREKVLNLSDDEIDEFDPEGGYVKREIRIVPTRREVKRRNSSSDLSAEEDDDEQQDDTGLNANEDDGEEQPQEEEGEEEQVFISPSNTKSLSIPMLNLLSIHSPSKSKTKAQLTKAKLEELRVKALFNPSDAAKLKAMKRGQDISFTGETRVEDDEEEDEQDILERYDFRLKDVPEHIDDEDGGGDGGEREDDDWESESEGWKREQTEEDW